MPAPMDYGKKEMTLEEIENDFSVWEDSLFVPENPPVLEAILELDKAVEKFCEEKLKKEKML